MNTSSTPHYIEKSKSNTNHTPIKLRLNIDNIATPTNDQQASSKSFIPNEVHSLIELNNTYTQVDQEKKENKIVNEANLVDLGNIFNSNRFNTSKTSRVVLDGSNMDSSKPINDKDLHTDRLIFIQDSSGMKDYLTVEQSLIETDITADNAQVRPTSRSSQALSEFSSLPFSHELDKNENEYLVNYANILTGELVANSENLATKKKKSKAIETLQSEGTQLENEKLTKLTYTKNEGVMEDVTQNNKPFSAHLANNKSVKSMSFADFSDQSMVKQHNRKKVRVAAIVDDTRVRENLLIPIDQEITDYSKLTLTSTDLKKLLAYMQTEKVAIVVELAFYIDDTGNVLTEPMPTIETSSGNKYLDKDSIHKVIQAKFKPFTVRNQPVPVFAEISVEY